MSNEVILINIYGEDKPWVTASVTEILGRYDAIILDVGQADIHHNLSLGFLVKLKSDEQSGNVLKDILFKCYELGVQVRFTPVSEDGYEEWVDRQGKGRYIVTMLGHVITAQQMALVSKAVAEQQMNIDSIKRLTGRPALNDDYEHERSCIEFSVRGELPDKSLLSSKFMEISMKENIDISFQKDDLYRRNRRLICFDMDSTLIKTEVIDELADRAGVGDEVRKITESAMRGEIDFSESFRRRVKLLKGLDESVMKEIAANLPIMDGADRLMAVLKKCGIRVLKIV